MSALSSSIPTCGSCGEDAAAVSHTCDVCGRVNHAICGIPINEGFGGSVRCVTCVPSLQSSSPLLAAFNTQLAQAVAQKAHQSDRHVQVVSTVASRVKVVRWMEAAQAGGMKRFIAAAVRRFPMLFRSTNPNTNLSKATDWWAKRVAILSGEMMSVVHRQPGITRRVELKAVPGRGPKRAPWVIWLHDEQESEFARLQNLGVKLSQSLLVEVAKDLLISSSGKYSATTRDDQGRLLIEKITCRWIQSFCERFDIVIRRRSSKLMCSPEKLISIERAVATHLSDMKRAFDVGQFTDDTTVNMDETHAVINMDNGVTLGFRGQENISYQDVVSGGEGMTLVIKLSGGVNARVEPVMVVFKNDICSYPIRGVPDDVPGATYRSGKKGWMDQRIFDEWIKDPLCNPPTEKLQNIFVDNAGGHKAGEGLSASNIALHFLPVNATHLCQPADSFVIQKIKEVWRQKWDKEKLRLIKAASFSNVPDKQGNWSGKLNNPGKPFFLQLAADCVAEVNKQRDVDGITYARKAMILCGLNNALNGKWEVKQLHAHLQEIVKKYPGEFNGCPDIAV